ncbi:MAG: ADP-ribosyltransferase family protein [Sulfobacillus sp.]
MAYPCHQKLLPQNGKCPPSFPILDEHGFEVPCCRKPKPGSAHELVLQRAARQKSRKTGAADFRSSSAPDDDCMYFLPLEGEVYLEDEAFYRGEDCEQLVSQLPSQSWLKRQFVYLRLLPPHDIFLLMLYSYRGDQFINGYLREGRRLTPELLKYLARHFRAFRPSVQMYLEKFGEGKTIADYADYLASQLQSLIAAAPPTDGRTVLFRGSYGEKYSQKSTEDGVYRAVGFLSTALMLEQALKFAAGKEVGLRFVDKVVVPPGYPCLYNALNFMHEHEVILSTGSKFYVTRRFQSMYVPDEFQMDEIVMVKSGSQGAEGRRRNAEPEPKSKPEPEPGLIRLKEFAAGVWTAPPAPDRPDYPEFLRWCSNIYSDADAESARKEFVKEYQADLKAERLSDKWYLRFLLSDL